MNKNNKVILALGSNLGDRATHLKSALDAVGRDIGAVLEISSFREYSPLLHPEYPTEQQQEFLNAVCIVETHLSPDELLAAIHAIEHEGGRVRKKGQTPWLPRTIDIDIIAYDEEVMETEVLTIPHKEMHARDFVLEPLCEIAPEWRHPVLDKTAKELLEDLNQGQ